MTQGTGDLPDEDCYWHSTAIGPMLVEKAGTGWDLWHIRPSARIKVFCGWFQIRDEALRMAHILAAAPDEAFT